MKIIIYIVLIISCAIGIYFSFLYYSLSLDDVPYSWQSVKAESSRGDVLKLLGQQEDDSSFMEKGRDFYEYRTGNKVYVLQVTYKDNIKTKLNAAKVEGIKIKGHYMGVKRYLR